jgi:DNA-binding transcriptional ArsR family regulator
MVDNETLDNIFHALSDATRRAIVAALAGGKERTVSEIWQPHDMSLAAVSKHLKVLERAGVVARRRDGRKHYVRLNPATLDDAGDWLAFHRRFWDERLDALSALVEAEGDSC